MVINLNRADEIWTLAQGAPLKAISEQYKQDINDQLIFMSVNITHPNQIAVLEAGWDMALTDRWRENNILGEKFPNVGQLHINGGKKIESFEVYHVTTNSSLSHPSNPKP